MRLDFFVKLQIKEMIKHSHQY